VVVEIRDSRKSNKALDGGRAVGGTERLTACLPTLSLGQSSLGSTADLRFRPENFSRSR
jgi:hypothetical protein